MNTNKSPEVGPNGWDKESVYDAEIAPLMAQIITICKREDIPMFASYLFRKSDDTGDGEDGFCTTHLNGPNGEFCDRFAKCAEIVRNTYNALLGFTMTRTKPSLPE